MRKIKYPLIVADCDGTILNSRHIIGDYTRQKIDEYVKDGGIFAVATGRMASSALSLVRAWGLKGIVSAFQGGVLMDIQTGELLCESKMPHELAVDICEKMEKMDLHIHTYSLWEVFSNRDNDWLKAYEKIVGEKAVIQENMSAFMRETKMEPYKLLAIVEPKDAKAVCKALAGQVPDECFVTISAPFLVEIGLKTSTKKKAVTFLAEHYHIPLENTIAVGDQLNDLPMLETAGLGVAVANAEAELKAMAYALPYTNDEDAVGKMIEELAYTEE